MPSLLGPVSTNLGTNGLYLLALKNLCFKMKYNEYFDIKVHAWCKFYFITFWYNNVYMYTYWYIVVYQYTYIYVDCKIQYGTKLNKQYLY